MDQPFNLAPPGIARLDADQSQEGDVEYTIFRKERRSANGIAHGREIL